MRDAERDPSRGLATPFDPVQAGEGGTPTNTVTESARDGGSASAPDHEFTLSLGQHNLDNKPKPRRVTLRELATQWRVPDTRRGHLSAAEYHALDKTDPDQNRKRAAEKNGEYFVAAEFDSDGRRANENIRAMTAFVLDFDSGRTTREVIVARLQGLAYIAYTSYSHLPDAPRWRVVIPYQQPISVEQHERVYKAFQERFDDDLDRSCMKPAQVYYTPACPHDAVDQYEMFWQDGGLLDAAALRAPGRPEMPPTDGARPSDGAGLDGGGRRLQQLQSALEHLDPDERGLWVRVGMAIKHDLGDDGMPSWLKWSERSPKFSRENAVATWVSLHPKRGQGAITLRTVYHHAKRAGWVPSATGSVQAEISELNSRYFVAQYGGRTAVFQESADPISGRVVAQPMTASDFKLLLANRTVLIEDDKGRISEKPLAQYWLTHPQRRQFEGVVFVPEQEVEGYYNLWKGFAVAPAQGVWKRMRWHMYVVLCRRDRRNYRYLLNWMAHAVQHPGSPAEVAVVLRGGRGAGKGVFARSFGALFGPHFLHITQARHLTGNFNRHLEDCVVLFVDEGFWAGDKQGEGTLKALITEPTLAIERKYFDVVTARNCLHIIVASNADWVVPAGGDERRFFVLEVDDSWKQNTGYFTPLYAEMEEAGLAAMLYDLQRRDLRRCNIRQVPQNRALGEQKLHSMDTFTKWWFGKLVNGHFSNGAPAPFDRMFPWGSVARSVVHDDYVHGLHTTGVSHKSTETELGRQLKKMLPPSMEYRTRRMEAGEQVPYYDLPPLEECRAHFEQVMNLVGRIDWEGGGFIGSSPSTPSTPVSEL